MLYTRFSAFPEILSCRPSFDHCTALKTRLRLIGSTKQMPKRSERHGHRSGRRNRVHPSRATGGFGMGACKEIKWSSRRISSRTPPVNMPNTLMASFAVYLNIATTQSTQWMTTDERGVILTGFSCSERHPPMSADIGECSNGARGRDRTGMGFPPRDFRTHYSFRCCMLSSCIWSLDFTFALSRCAI